MLMDSVGSILEERELVCLNDGRGTRIDVHMGMESVLDLTLCQQFG